MYIYMFFSRNKRNFVTKRLETYSLKGFKCYEKNIKVLRVTEKNETLEEIV